MIAYPACSSACPGTDGSPKALRHQPVKSGVKAKKGLKPTGSKKKKNTHTHSEKQILILVGNYPCECAGVCGGRRSAFVVQTYLLGRITYASLIDGQYWSGNKGRVQAIIMHIATNHMILLYREHTRRRIQCGHIIAPFVPCVVT